MLKERDIPFKIYKDGEECIDLLVGKRKPGHLTISFINRTYETKGVANDYASKINGIMKKFGVESQRKEDMKFLES